jgi:hypothetical protein
MSRGGRGAVWGSRVDPLGGWTAPRRRPRRSLRARRPQLAALLLGLLLAGLALAALRIDALRVRYALNSANNREEALKEQRAELVVRLRQLRNPERLAAEARRLGLRRPERVIDLPDAGVER